MKRAATRPTETTNTQKQVSTTPTTACTPHHQHQFTHSSALASSSTIFMPFSNSRTSRSSSWVEQPAAPDKSNNKEARNAKS